jgi:hypothetical protein
MCRPRKWTLERVKKISLMYPNKRAFRVGNPNAYRAACERGYLRDLQIPRTGPRIWTKSAVLEEAKKYQTRKTFQIGCQSAYNSAQINGWLDLLDFAPQRTKWCRDSIYKVAKEYSERRAFRAACSGAYRAACKRKMLNELYPNN